MPETGLGLQIVLRSHVSGDHPMSFAETPGGLMLLANGVDPMLRWDGLASLASAAGIAPPPAGPDLGGIGPGTITGTLVAYQRFVDANGNVSDLSPPSNVMDAGRDGLIEDVDYSRTTGVVTVRSAGHGLVVGDSILIDGVTGIDPANGSFGVNTVPDGDTFTLWGLVNTAGVYEAGGTWTLGVNRLVYGNLALPTGDRVVRRQILRNLSGNGSVLYVDVDTDDLTATSFESATADDILVGREPVPLTYGPTELPFANRHGVPPSHKAVLASHKGRIFAAVDRPYSLGHVEPRFNQRGMFGVGTDWPASLAGRNVYIEGARSSYLVESIDPAFQVLVLDRPFLEVPSRPYAAYTIAPEPGERRLIYYSEPGLPESWPRYNAIGVTENNDEIVSLVTLGNYLYVVEKRHIHRLTFDRDPAVDGYLFLTAFRGSLNHRTHATTEGSVYFMDEVGVHKFDGESATPVSGPVQNVFQGDDASPFRIDWSADQALWHAAHDPVWDTIRWFVAMVGSDGTDHALCYNYRMDRWWVERYPTPIACSCNATIGHRRSLAGTTARRVICLSEGEYDGVDGTGTLRGSPTSATSTVVADASADFHAIEGVPVSIVDGTGRGQDRLVAASTATTFEVTRPWDVTPDETSVYQVGGIRYEWQSGWFRFFEDEGENPRDVEVVFRPTTARSLMDLALYFDHSPTPRRWARSLTQDGVRTVEGEPEIAIDLGNRDEDGAATGWARQRFADHAERYARGDRFVSARLSGVQAGAPVRVAQVILNGVQEV